MEQEDFLDNAGCEETVIFYSDTESEDDSNPPKVHIISEDEGIFQMEPIQLSKTSILNVRRNMTKEDTSPASSNNRGKVNAPKTTFAETNSPANKTHRYENVTPEESETEHERSRRREKYEPGYQNNLLQNVIDTILPIYPERHNECKYPCGISTSDPKLPKYDYESTDSKEGFPEEDKITHEGTGQKYSKQEWNRIDEFNRHYEKIYQVLTDVHNETEHGEQKCVKDDILVKDVGKGACFQDGEVMQIVKSFQSMLAHDSTLYEEEKTRNDILEASYRALQRNLDIMIDKAREREKIMANKNSDNARQRKEMYVLRNDLDSAECTVRLQEAEIVMLRRRCKILISKNEDLKGKLKETEIKMVKLEKEKNENLEDEKGNIFRFTADQRDSTGITVKAQKSKFGSRVRARKENVHTNSYVDRPPARLDNL
jgi:hypothetical protein